MVAMIVPPPAVLHLPVNRTGRDFVVGDIHGCFSLLDRHLTALKFDPNCDRLFSVGDMVDRGPESPLALNYLRKAWFYAVRGNHEEVLMMSRHHRSRLRLPPEGIGDGWWSEVDDRFQAEFLAELAVLPLAIDIDGGAFGIVHADIPYDLSWNDFLGALSDGDEETRWAALWQRDRVLARDRRGVVGVGKVYVGHTVVETPLQLGNLNAIDTGAVYGWLGTAGMLTVTEIGS